MTETWTQSDPLIRLTLKAIVFHRQNAYLVSGLMFYIVILNLKKKKKNALSCKISFLRNSVHLEIGTKSLPSGMEFTDFCVPPNKSPLRIILNLKPFACVGQLLHKDQWRLFKVFLKLF